MWPHKAAARDPAQRAQEARRLRARNDGAVAGGAEGRSAPPPHPRLPLMHGTGLFTAIGTTMNGGAIVTS